MALWGADKPDQKQQASSSGGGVGWLRSPQGYKVVRIAGAWESRWAKWVEVTDADITSDGRAQVRHTRRMLRFNAEQLWKNLNRQGWERVPPQWRGVVGTGTRPYTPRNNGKAKRLIQTLCREWAYSMTF